MRKVLILASSIIILLISGCSSQRIHTVSSMGTASHFNASQMSWFERMNSVTNKTLVFTSLVDVNNLKQSSNFGRLYTDLMISQLEQEGWKIIDYRGEEIVSRSGLGEFYLNRSKLKSIPKDASVFVGTYGKYKNGLLLNLRILRMSDNRVLTTSSILLEDNEALSMAEHDHCKNLSCYKPAIKKPNNTYSIKVVKDDCSNADNCAGVK